MAVDALEHAEHQLLGDSDVWRCQPALAEVTLCRLQACERLN